MSIPPIAAPVGEPRSTLEPHRAEKPEDVVKVSHQFESILLRQFLSESMKPLLDGGPAGNVYGYLLTDSLASSISDGGGLGLCSILQTQLSTDTDHAQP